VPTAGEQCLRRIARTEKVNDSYLSRILRQTLIAPDLTEAILNGRQPSALHRMMIY
jgi:hypothetical protein